MQDQLAFKLVGWANAKRPAQALGVVDLLDEPRQALCDILKRLAATDVDVLGLRRLHIKRRLPCETLPTNPELPEMSAVRHP